jgi:hypothetical protein
MKMLNGQKALLRDVFDAITYERDGIHYFSSRFNRTLAEANIRKAFYDKRGYTTKEELVPSDARLLKIENFEPSVSTKTPSDYCPEQKDVEKIIAADRGELTLGKQEKDIIRGLEAIGQLKMARQLKEKYSAHPEKDRSFHYLPYKTDSGFEEAFLREMFTLADENNVKLLSKYGLEIYYNGDRALTEFRIRCYKKIGARWDYIGMYTPDFLIVSRKGGNIHKAVMVETKGRVYANDPNFIKRRTFMKEHFTPRNNREFGYNRFEYLYLEDSLPEKDRIAKTHQAITAFFGEDETNA